MGFKNVICSTKNVGTKGFIKKYFFYREIIKNDVEYCFLGLEFLEADHLKSFKMGFDTFLGTYHDQLTTQGLSRSA